ncbi:solute carrier family 25 protein, partial [archaeon]
SFLLSPLDILRTRLQSSAGRGTPPWQLTKRIFQKEGFPAFYRGLVPTVLGVGPSRALYFGSFQVAKRQISAHTSLHGAVLHLSAATAAGLLTNTVMSPWWVIRVRLQLQSTPIESSWARLLSALQRHRMLAAGASAASPGSARVIAAAAASMAPPAQQGYKGVVDCAVRVYREEGWRAFYRGLSASYLGVIETACQFGLYGYMKDAYIRKSVARLREQPAYAHASDRELRRGAFTDGAAFTLSAASKLLAAVITYPHEVLRTRMREPRTDPTCVRYHSIGSTLRSVIAEEGFRGLYGGMSVHLLRTVPNAAILLLVVEKVVGGDV